MAEDKFNRKNPAVKRILQEIKAMQSNPSDDFMSLPLEEFEGGIYHGRIQLPAEYPFKPPSFVLSTPNGRFETQTKICLSICNHHPQHWQPSWSVRTALVALIAFMPTSPNGALGSLDYKKEEGRKLAVRSREAAPRYGNSNCQKLIDETGPRIYADQGSSSTSTSGFRRLGRKRSHSRETAASEEKLNTSDERKVVKEQPRDAPLRKNQNPVKEV